MNVRPVYLVAYGRSPYCKAFKGGLSKIHPVQFGGQTLAGVLQRIPQLKPEDIDDVVVGCAMPKGVQDYNIARQVAQRAGLPDRVPAMTINRFCSSGLQTVATAANTIACGQAEVIVAGGVESMSMVPMATDPNIVEPYLLKHAPDNYISMGMTAEYVAAEYHISREDMERMACESHRKAAQAQAAGWFEDQIIPVDGLDGQGNPVVLTVDEGVRPGASMESLAQLKPCHMKVTHDGETLEGDFIYGMVSDSVSVGGFRGLKEKDVKLDDGLFEVMLVKNPRTPEELSTILNALMKKQPDGNVIGFQSADIAFTAEHPVAWTLDGEFGGDMETVRVCNRPRAIRIMRG